MPTNHRDRRSASGLRGDGETRAGHGDVARSGRPSREWYLQIAWRLDEIETRAKDENEFLVVPILSALRELCIACGDFSAEAERHDRERNTALRHERDLRRDVHVVLETLTHAEPPPMGVSRAERRSASPKPSGLTARERAAGISGFRRFQAQFGPELSALALALDTEPEPTPDLGVASVGTARSARSPSTAQARPRPSLAVYCLGPFQVYLDEQLVEQWPGHKGLSLFKYLLLNRRRRVLKDVLYELFWPDVEPEACRRNLHQAIYSLRHTLRRHRPDIRSLLFEGDCYFLNPEIDIWIDAEEFDEHVIAGQRLDVSQRPHEAMEEYGKAEALYDGHLFEECLYEDWVGVERERRRSAYTHVAGRLAVGYIDRHEYSAAIVLCQKALTLDRCNEDAHRRLMQCYEAQGQRHLALRQFHACSEALRTDLDLAPTEETIALNDVLRQVGTSRFPPG